MKNWKKEKEDWVDLVDFHVWKILKMLEIHRKLYIREFRKKGFNESSQTLQERLGKLEEWGCVRIEEDTGRYYHYLTDRGKKLLSLFDKIGEMVHKIRSEK